MKLRLILLILLLFLAACSSSKPSGGGTSAGGATVAFVSGRLSVQLPDGYIVGTHRDWEVGGRGWVPEPKRPGLASREVDDLGFVAEESATWREWIVGVSFWMEAEELAAKVAPLGAQVVRKLYGSDAYLIRFTTPRSADSPEVRELHGISGVAYVEPNGAVSALVREPNDEYFEEQTNLHMTFATEAWNRLAELGDVRSGGFFQPVEVAVVDTGVCPQHPDLPGVASWFPRKSFLDPPYEDAIQCEGDTHGTEVASVLLALTNNGIGIAGAFAQELWADGTSVLRPTAARVLDNHGNGTIDAVAGALNWLADERRVKVANLSFGGTTSSRTLEEAVRNAAGADILLVAAAGNADDCRGRICYPAAYDDVIAVGSVNPTGEWSSFSSTGPQLDLVAPGGGVRVATSGGKDSYVVKSGTSFAAPAVSAAAAMLFAAGLDDPQAVKDVLLFTARSIDGHYDKFRHGHSNEYGWGLLDMGAALALRNRPVVFVARESGDRTSLTRISAMVSPSPNGFFQVDSAAAEDDLYLIGWVDSDHDRRVSDGDYFAKEPIRGGSRTVNLMAVPYRGPSIAVD